MDSQRLKRHFDAWEARMRGFSLRPYRVPIEPSYRPLLGRQRMHQGVVDDGRTPGFFERFRRNEKRVQTQRDITPVPQPVLHEGTGEIVELQLLADSNFSTQAAVGTTLLASLTDTTFHLGFEVVGTANKVVVQFVSDEYDRLALRRAFRTYVPEVRLVEKRKYLRQAWQQAGAVTALASFGLADRVFHKLRTFGRNEPDPLEEIIGRMEDARAGETLLVQVLLAPVRAPWGIDLEEFLSNIEDAGKTIPLASAKFSEPSFAATIRLAVRGHDEDRVLEHARSLAAALRNVTRSSTNELALLKRSKITVEEELEDIIARQTRRRGMILSVSELHTIAHVPNASVRSQLLVRATVRTRAAPESVARAGLLLGVNEHDNATRPVALRTTERLRHVLVAGSTGTGKSTLIVSMAMQDVEAGNGFVLIDAHGDLTSDVLARIPEHRARDVILFDPADDSYPIAFNALSANSEIEKTLLASDFVAIFRRLSSTTFGDVMVSVLSNAVLAILESSEGGTLLDLRHFLVDAAFRKLFLESVADHEVRYYWQHEFPLIKGVPHSSILTRLNAFLRPRVIRHIVAQRENRLDMRAAMDGKKIVLAKLSRGLIGEENSNLLGSLLVAKIAQATISRQNEEAARRVPFACYIDEAHAFATPSVADILSGARKYAMSLCFVTGSMSAVRTRNEEVASALLAHAYTRIVFRVGDQDAKLFSDGCAFFDPKDFQNLSLGQAIVRIERPDVAFNISTQLPLAIPDALANGRRNAVRQASRATYGAPRREVEVALQTSYASIATAYDSKPPRKTRVRQSEAREEEAREPRPGRGGAQHRYLQSLVQRVGEARGYDVSLEREILDGHGYVDVILERGETKIACEIAVTTGLAHELGNLTKCLSADFSFVVFVSSRPSLLKAARTEAGVDTRLRFLSPENFISFLDELESGEPKGQITRQQRRDEPALETASGKRRMLGTEEAAAHVGLSRQTLAKLRVVGDSPKFHKLGARVVYDPDDLDAWLASRKRSSTSDAGSEGKRRPRGRPRRTD